MTADAPSRNTTSRSDSDCEHASAWESISKDSVLEWDSCAVVHAERDIVDAILLERGGTTSQPPGVSKNKTPRLKQVEMWRKGTTHKWEVARKLHEQGQHALALKLDNCHSEWTIAECGSCHVARKFANRCDLFCCPECQHSLQVRRSQQVEWWTKTVKQPKHVVLTIHNLPDLTPGHLTHFKKMFARLRRRKFAKNWIGGFYRIEITNEGRGWHLHLHALVEAKWIDKQALSNNWKSITNGLGYIVDVQDCRGEGYLREVTKYVVKGSELSKWSGPDIATFVTAFANQRTFGVFGKLYGMRTKFADFVDSLRESKSQCPCGANCMRYWSEPDWLARVRPAARQHQAHAPPPPPAQPQLFTLPLRWPD